MTLHPPTKCFLISVCWEHQIAGYSLLMYITFWFWCICEKIKALSALHAQLFYTVTLNKPIFKTDIKSPSDYIIGTLPFKPQSHIHGNAPLGYYNTQYRHVEIMKILSNHIMWHWVRHIIIGSLKFNSDSQDAKDHSGNTIIIFTPSSPTPPLLHLNLCKLYGRDIWGISSN